MVPGKPVDCGLPDVRLWYNTIKRGAHTLPTVKAILHEIGQVRDMRKQNPGKRDECFEIKQGQLCIISYVHVCSSSVLTQQFRFRDWKRYIIFSWSYFFALCAVLVLAYDYRVSSRKVVGGTKSSRSEQS